MSISAVMTVFSSVSHAQQPVTARQIVERAITAHGGELFLEPGTLQLSGSAIFYDSTTGEPRSIASDYRMWRVMDAERTSAHGAAGKVRIRAQSDASDDGEVIFEVGYDGETTWTERGIMPKPQADAYWASNFGFGIIRSALDEGFTLRSLPPRDFVGRLTEIVRITDPQGQATLFGFDGESGFIRYMAFDSPRGFHERLYDDFVRLDNGWVQARSVTLLYDGVISNTVFWTETRVGEAIDHAIFAPPPDMRLAE
ncbi:MAG: hypothetical protein AAF941_01695 [Pseudomonadota bacterium]